MQSFTVAAEQLCNTDTTDITTTTTLPNIATTTTTYVARRLASGLLLPFKNRWLLTPPIWRSKDARDPAWNLPG
jgi:hypothetical protein